MRKKVLLLGGAHTQIPSIVTAKRLGHYVITCDYLPNNPGHRLADEYHNVSTTDKEAVFELARKLNVDGIVCYASDVSASAAAYASERLGLPTSPYASVDLLTNKDKFRAFLAQHGFCTPRARGYASVDEAKADIANFKLPVMVKPVDSAGSKGVTLLSDVSKLAEQAAYALTFSRCKRFIIEEYVTMYGYQIAGDGFSVDGRLAFRCFANEHFSEQAASPFVPIGESFPYNMPASVHEKVHQEIQRLFTLLNMKTQAYNFDIRVDADTNVYLMEVGPRNGGNMIAQVIQKATGVDIVEYMIKAAVGESCADLQMTGARGFWSCYVLHAKSGGKFAAVHYAQGFRESNLVEEHIHCQVGAEVVPFTGSNGTVGILILKFGSLQEMIHKMDHMDEFVSVVVE